MFRVATFITLITACFVFSGCPKKKDKPAPTPAKKAEPKKAEPKKAEPKKAEPKKAEPAKGATMPDNIKGVASCEAYFKAYNCYIGKLPAAGQDAAKKAMKMTTDAWAKVPKAGLEAGCKAAVDGLKKVAANPAMKKMWEGCLPK